MTAWNKNCIINMSMSTKKRKSFRKEKNSINNHDAAWINVGFEYYY